MASTRQPGKAKVVAAATVTGRSYCSVVPATDPQHLSPGESGTLLLILAMNQRAVLQPGTPFKLDYEPRQGPLTLGQWSREPAPTASLYRRYAGQRVYDNTCTVRIPVSVAAGAAFGKYEFEGRIETLLHDGRKGSILGPYKEVVVGEVEVGAPLPRAPKAIVRPKARVGGNLVKANLGFALSSVRRVRVRAGTERRVAIQLTVPAGYNVARDDRRELPALLLTRLGEGLSADAGDPPAVGALGYEGVYQRTVVLRAASNAPPGQRKVGVELRYTPRQGTRALPLETVSLTLPVEVLPPPGPEGELVAATLGPENVEGAGSGGGQPGLPPGIPEGSSAPDLVILVAGGAVALVLGALVVHRLRTR